mgnify:FL=1
MRWYSFIGVFLAVLAIIGIVFTSLPVPSQTTTIPFYYGDTQAGTLTLTLPQEIRAGDEAKVTLQVDYLQGSSTETSKLIDRLESGDLFVSPKGEGQVLIDPHKSTYFIWQIRSFSRGECDGVVWLFEQKPGAEPSLILSRKFTLTSVYFLGVSYSLARILSLLLLIVGIGLVSPYALRKLKKSRYSIAEDS